MRRSGGLGNAGRPDIAGAMFLREGRQGMGLTAESDQEKNYGDVVQVRHVLFYYTQPKIEILLCMLLHPPGNDELARRSAA